MIDALNSGSARSRRFRFSPAMVLGGSILWLASASVGSPPNSEDLDAESLFEQGRYREALNALDREPSGGNARTETLRARLLFNQGVYSEAEALLEAPAFDDKDLEADRLSLRARLAEAKGETERAVTIQTRAIELRRSSVDSVETIDGANTLAKENTRLGDIAFRAGRIEDAQNAYRAAIRLVNRAHMKLHELGVPHDESDPRLFAAGATAGLARVQAAQGDNRRAERTWRSIAARTNDPFDLLDLVIFAKSQGDDRAAERHLRRLLERSEETPHRRAAAALALADFGASPDEALSLARAAFEAAPNLNVRDALAWCLYRNGDHERAAEVLAPALEFGVKHPRFLYHAGMIEHALGHTDRARERLEAALAIHPRFDPIAAPHARSVLESLR